MTKEQARTIRIALKIPLTPALEESVIDFIYRYKDEREEWYSTYSTSELKSKLQEFKRELQEDADSNDIASLECDIRDIIESEN